MSEHPRHNSEPRNPAQEQTRLRASATRPGPRQEAWATTQHNSAAPGPEAEECRREEAEQDTALLPPPPLSGSAPC